MLGASVLGAHGTCNPLLIIVAFCPRGIFSTSEQALTGLTCNASQTVKVGRCSQTTRGGGGLLPHAL